MPTSLSRCRATNPELNGNCTASTTCRLYFKPRANPGRAIRPIWSLLTLHFARTEMPAMHAWLELLTFAVKSGRVDPENGRRFLQSPGVREDAANMFCLDLFDPKFSAEPDLRDGLDCLRKIV